MVSPKLLLDADGVFVDLHPVLAKIHDFKMEAWKPGEYNIEVAFPHITANDLWEHPEVKDAEFWAELPRTPWADELMAYLLTKFDAGSIFFLTMPVRDPNCAAGKMKWFQKYYPKFKFLIGTSKNFCAGPGRYLIDDSDKNIIEFNQHGGAGILFPRIWNSLHEVKDPVKYVKERMGD
jgi:5'(3')-deoxyribonucleotidase